VPDFLTDIKTLCGRAREKIEQGPITGSYGADRDRVVEVLNEALATELVCVLRYKRHYYMAVRCGWLCDCPATDAPIWRYHRARRLDVLAQMICAHVLARSANSESARDRQIWACGLR
jgi:hypothetical protein